LSHKERLARRIKASYRAHLPSLPLANESAYGAHPKALRQQRRALGGASKHSPCPKVECTAFAPTLDPVPGSPASRGATPRRIAHKSIAFGSYIDRVAYPCPHDLLPVQGHPDLQPRARSRLRIRALAADCISSLSLVDLKRPLAYVREFGAAAPLPGGRKGSRDPRGKRVFGLPTRDAGRRPTVLERTPRSHNPTTSVAWDCHRLQNRLRYAESFARGCPPLLRGAPWVVSKVVSNGIANHYGCLPCRTEYLVGRGDLVRDLARASETTPASQREKWILLQLATGGPHMTMHSPLRLGASGL
jgi:hypothetical protein